MMDKVQKHNLFKLVQSLALSLQFSSHACCPFFYKKFVLCDLFIVGPCHHGMACPWVVGRGGGVQIWGTAVNILLNKQL
jgi:hypothetical protein